MSPALLAAVTAVSALPQINPDRQPLPAEPPISGPFWTVLVPGVLLVFSIWATWLLYRHFAKEE